MFNRFFIIIALIFVIFVAQIAESSGMKPDQSISKEFKKIVIKNDPVTSGIFDISIEYDDEGIGWMAYSYIKLPKFVETKIARSDNKGKTWRYVSTVNHSREGYQLVNNKKQKGVWRRETPSLLYDPGDKPGRRWKLFFQNYLSEPPYKKGNSLYGEGWIAYKYAPSPEGPWSKSVRLFGSKANKCKVDLNTLHPKLTKNAFYNEIGTIVVDNIIYLSVDASTAPKGGGDWKNHKILLFSSPDHGMKWNYVGTLTDHDDAGKFGYFIFTGSSLVREGNNYYLLATPAGRKGLFVKRRGHDGIYVMQFEDISKAKLKRDGNSKLIVTKIIEVQHDRHSGGLGDYDEQNSNGGIVISQLSTKKEHGSDFFQVFNTRENIKIEK